jgi:hypothetical protein
MQEWNTRLFKENNARLPGILAFADFVQEPEWGNIKRDTREKAAKREMMMLRGAGKGGVEWLQNAVSHRDMEFLEGRKFTKEEIWGALAPGLSSMLAVNATEANARSGRATYNEKTLYPILTMMQKKITHQILVSYGENLVGEFDDVRVTDRELELSEQTEYGKTHTINEVRKEKYDEDPLPDNDPRGKMFIAEISPRQVAPSPTGDVPANGKVPPAAVPGQAQAEQPVAQKPGAISGAVAKPAEPGAGKMASDEIVADLKRWERKALKKIGTAVAFESDVIPQAVKAYIEKELPACEDAPAVKALFGDAVAHVADTPNEDDVKAILQGLFLTVQAIKEANAKPAD